MDFAIKGKHTEYEQINLYATYVQADQLYSLVLKIANSFKTDAKTAYKQYLQLLKTEKVDAFQLLINHKYLLAAGIFYEQEADILVKSLLDCKLFINSLSILDRWRFKFQGYDRRVIERDRQIEN